MFSKFNHFFSLLIAISISCGVSVSAQTTPATGTLVETTYIEIGTVNQMSVTVVKVNDLIANTTKSFLRIEHIPKSIFVDKTKKDIMISGDVDELAASMKSVVSIVFSSTRKDYSEISLKSKTGIEAGCMFILDKPKPISTTEKTYITATDDKMFEGKTVYRDEKGAYIWKTANPNATADVSGHWMTFVQIEEFATSSRVLLTTDEFKKMLELVEKGKTRM